MHYKEVLLILWVLMFRSTSESCTSRHNISAIEGEFFYLKDCLPPNKNNTSTVEWYKISDSLGRVALTSSSSPRIVLRNYSLEFWPLELDDSGNYIFCVGNHTYKWKLKVFRRNNDSNCHSEYLSYSKHVKVGTYLSIKCEENYAGLTNNISLYKDCGTRENGVSFIKESAEFEDRGYYTCVYFFLHNKKQFHATKTYNVAIIEDESINIPYILGPKSERIEVELGKDIQLNCTASVDKYSLLYWIDENSFNVHKEKLKSMNQGNKMYNSAILKIEKVNEENLNTLYNCCLDSGKGLEIKTFILVKKGMADISDHVFTSGMIVAALISLIIVCMGIAAIIYRVDLVLFYRRFMRRDETLTDGKMYDAFVSYLKETQTENGEAHTFAVKILPRVLETQFGYKLCIFERDVVPGQAIVDEVHSLIEKSRRLIIVLSKSYMSNEVRYELESGLHKALVERKIKIILIKFASVGDFSFLPQSLELLKSHRVLKWKTDKSLSYNSRFWKNLLYLMPAKVIKPCKDEAELFPLFS